MGETSRDGSVGAARVVAPRSIQASATCIGGCYLIIDGVRASGSTGWAILCESSSTSGGRSVQTSASCLGGCYLIMNGVRASSGTGKAVVLSESSSAGSSRLHRSQWSWSQEQWSTPEPPAARTADSMSEGPVGLTGAVALNAAVSVGAGWPASLVRGTRSSNSLSTSLFSATATGSADASGATKTLVHVVDCIGDRWRKERGRISASGLDSLVASSSTRLRCSSLRVSRSLGTNVSSVLALMNDLRNMRCSGQMPCHGQRRRHLRQLRRRRQHQQFGSGGCLVDTGQQFLFHVGLLVNSFGISGSFRSNVCSFLTLVNDLRNLLRTGLQRCWLLGGVQVSASQIGSLVTSGVSGACGSGTNSGSASSNTSSSLTSDALFAVTESTRLGSSRCLVDLRKELALHIMLLVNSFGVGGSLRLDMGLLLALLYNFRDLLGARLQFACASGGGRRRQTNRFISGSCTGSSLVSDALLALAKDARLGSCGGLANLREKLTLHSGLLTDDLGGGGSLRGYEQNRQWWAPCSVCKTSSSEPSRPDSEVAGASGTECFSSSSNAAFSRTTPGEAEASGSASRFGGILVGLGELVLGEKSGANGGSTSGSDTTSDGLGNVRVRSGLCSVGSGLRHG
ncbi:hypothetical protein KCU65_g122, partial [Aureobasidium melanogenum]